MFVPGFWDVVAPLEDLYNLMASGDAAAAEALDEVAPRMQDSLDQAWETWESLGAIGVDRVTGSRFPTP